MTIKYLYEEVGRVRRQKRQREQVPVVLQTAGVLVKGTQLPELLPESEIRLIFLQEFTSGCSNNISMDLLKNKSFC